LSATTRRDECWKEHGDPELADLERRSGVAES
jgi:hypothetical protein